uniref:Acetylglutamate kinase n=1 Tax=Plocamium cartilagineum TaxID=31452 RepID=A0A1C9CHX9_PLOCA|nr:acetylglutamate kinase [Plocamium cartilagineum]AOM67996.1 acetylglutamate kinase [Plocamium cartilagineum]
MLDNLQRITILNEIIPFIQQLAGNTIVIKYGGSAMKNQYLKMKVLEDILFLSYIGLKPVLVHGGGPMINSWLKRVNIEPRFENGVRITNKETMELVEMVLVGKVNKELVALLNQNDAKAIGLCGKDTNLIIGSKRFHAEDNYVGSVKKVNKKIITLLLDEGYIPVISSIAVDEKGQSYNINADTVASALAEELSAQKLILLTDTPGIMYDLNNPETLYRSLNIIEAQNLKKEKIVSGGMIPKIDCCIKALKGSVNSAHIIDGRIEHSLLLEILTSARIGSMLIP